jgi:hypothetical protein
MDLFPSRFAALSRPGSAAVLAAAAVALAWLLHAALTGETLAARTPARPAEGSPGAGPAWDGAFYRNVVARVRAGEGYHDAAQAEFADPAWAGEGFRPTSVFHWRTPLYAWGLAALPGPEAAHALAALLAVVVAAAAFAAVRREQGPAQALAVGLLLGPFAWCVVGQVYLFTELWAGMLLALSVAAYALGRRPLAVACGLLALFLRELALLYALLGLVLALGRRRRGEAAAWAAGLALFALFYAWHVGEVRGRLGAGEGGPAADWVRFGGAAFVLGTVRMGNVFLIAAPAWVSALLLPLALLGLAGWRGEVGVRAGLTCAGYLAAFLFAGKPGTAYWGLLTAPLLALGLIGAPRALRDLLRAPLRVAAQRGGGLVQPLR